MSLGAPSSVVGPVRAIREAAEGTSPAALLAGVARLLAAARGLTGGVDPPELLRRTPDEPADLAGVVPEGAPADLLGLLYEALLTTDHRRATGSFFTPSPIADGLMAFASAGQDAPSSVCDPAVGAGAFLLAAGRHLERRGLDRQGIARDVLWGVDLDPLAVAVTDCTLYLWSGETARPARPADHLTVGDALLGRHGLGDTSFDLVIGNPPFQNQLEGSTARDRVYAEKLRSRYGDHLGAYTDTAALFLLAALDLVAPGGRVALILPESFLSARDADAVRARALDLATVDGLWTAGEHVFDAAVDVCAPVLERSTVNEGSVRRAIGPAFDPLPPVDRWNEEPRSTWSPLMVRGPSLGDLEAGSPGRLADFCEATAGFRDQYYGLVGTVIDDVGGDDLSTDEYPLLVTSGLIDPGVCWWGCRPARFARQAWSRPRIDLEALRRAEPRLATWAEDRLVPKLVVATQTRVIEAAVDIDGSWYPSTPTIAVTCDPDRLWHVAAVLLAPAASLWALHRVAGGALARDAIKLAARDVLDIPLPRDQKAWDEAAALLEAVVPRGDGTLELGEPGRAMNDAYGTGDGVFCWWQQRLPRR